MSAIPFTLYPEIMNYITPAEIEDIDVTIKLANRDPIFGRPYSFSSSWFPTRLFCPIIFGRPFLNTVNATMDCHKNYQC